MELQDFLVKAKINTYASSGEGGEKKLEDGGRELIFENGEYKYRDRYFGFNPFIGEGKFVLIIFGRFGLIKNAVFS